jgi:hypothetical protein
MVLEVKWLGSEAGYSPPSGAKVNVELYLHSPIQLHGIEHN